MTAYLNAAGTRYTKATFPKTAAADPLVTLTADVYKTEHFDEGNVGAGAVNDGSVIGSIKTLAFKAGTELRQSQIDALFRTATIGTATPATGPAAGGTAVVLTGTDLDGVTAVTVGGVAATALVVVSPREIHFTTPAHAAGAVSIVLTDDSGTVTKTNAFTYA